MWDLYLKILIKRLFSIHCRCPCSCQHVCYLLSSHNILHDTYLSEPTFYSIDVLKSKLMTYLHITTEYDIFYKFLKLALYRSVHSFNFGFTIVNGIPQ